MSQEPISAAIRVSVPLLLVLLGAYVMLRWGASCGYTIGEVQNYAPNGRGCGVVRHGAGILLPFCGLAPVGFADRSRVYQAVGAVVLIDLLVALVLAPGG